MDFTANEIKIIQRYLEDYDSSILIDVHINRDNYSEKMREFARGVLTYPFYTIPACWNSVVLDKKPEV